MKVVKKVSKGKHKGTYKISCKKAPKWLRSKHYKTKEYASYIYYFYLVAASPNYWEDECEDIIKMEREISPESIYIDHISK